MRRRQRACVALGLIACFAMAAGLGMGGCDSSKHWRPAKSSGPDEHFYPGLNNTGVGNDLGDVSR